MKTIRILAAAALGLLAATACSDDAATLSPSSDCMQSFTASFDPSPVSRAGADDAELPVRALLFYREQGSGSWNTVSATPQDNSFSFSVEMDSKKTYDIAVWADDNASYTQENPETISYADENTTTPGIAFAARKTGFRPDGTQAQLELKHVVAKLVVNETGTLGEGDIARLSFGRTNYTYNILTDTYTPSAATATTAVALRFTATAAENTGTIMKCFMFAPASEAMMTTATLGYYHAEKDRECPEMTIDNVSFRSNRSTVFNGTFRSLETLADMSFVVAVDKEWSENTSTEYPATFDSSSTEDLSTFLTNHVGTAKGLTVKFTGSYGQDDLQALVDFLSTGEGKDAEMTVDLSGAELTYYNTPPTFGNDDPSLAATGLKAIILPASVNSISAYKFQNCVNLQSIDLSNITAVNFAAFQNTALTSIDLSSCTVIWGSAFNGCASLTEIKWPSDGVECKIWQGAFKGSGLTGEFVVPDNVAPQTDCGGDFFDNTAITKLSLPGSFGLSDQLISDMPELTELKYRGDVSTIHRNAIEQTTIPKLTTIDLSETTVVPTLPSALIFGSTTNLKVIVRDEAMKSAFAADTNWSEEFTADQFVVKE